MADPHLDNLLKDLGAAFEAAGARGDDAAAADLAESFLQGHPLGLVLERGGPAVLHGRDGVEPVVEVGADFLVTRGARLVPLAGAVVALGGEGESPRSSSETFLERLRRTGRDGAYVLVTTGAGRFEGVLQRVAEDHLRVRTSGGEVCIGRGAVEAIRLVRAR